jgi:hypothetical protein
VNQDAGLTERLMAELRRSELPEDLPQRAAARRLRVVGQIRKAIEGPMQRMGTAGWRGWAVAAAAAAVLALGGTWAAWAQWSTGESAAQAAGKVRAIAGRVSLVRKDGTVTVEPSAVQALGAMDELRTSTESVAALVTSHGVRVRVAASSALRVALVRARPREAAERMELLTGRVDVDVPEDGSKRTFSVETPDAVVTVHGTVFGVTVGKAMPTGKAVTSVQVTRGRVSVRTRAGTTMLTPGSTWSSASETAGGAVATAARRPDDAAARTAVADPGPQHEPGRQVRVADSERTSLSEENRLYRAAMQFKRQHQDERVVEILARLVERYPGSPLAPDACVERFRALERLGRTAEAARSARKYLAEHPGGFAQDEARDLALEVDAQKPSEEQ